MATIREYFDTDAQALTVHTNWTFGTDSGEVVADLIAKIAYNLEANAKYWYFYIPAISDLSLCLKTLFNLPDFESCRLRAEGDGVYIDIGSPQDYERLSTDTLQFTKRVFLYLDFDLSPENRRSLIDEALTLGYYLSIRDREYATKRSESEKPLAFISHDSRDKDPLVRELAHELIKLMCPVWYDEYSLSVGDSLRASIEKGLKETRKCIVILSPHFLSNGGWGKAEFDSVFTREIIERNNVILPVWHNVNVSDVYQYSPRLADKVGLNSTLGVSELAKKLSYVIKNT